MNKRNIYVASSWRNNLQQFIVAALRELGHEVYDFKHSKSAFKWSDIDTNWMEWTATEYQSGLKHKLAENGFMRDKYACDNANTCLLVLPSGKSSHLEAGYMKGQGKELYIFSIEMYEPELMYKFADKLFFNNKDLVKFFEVK